MKIAGLVFTTIAVAVLLSPQAQPLPEKRDTEGVLKEFFSSNPSNDKLLTVLEKGAGC